MDAGIAGRLEHGDLHRAIAGGLQGVLQGVAGGDSCRDTVEARIRAAARVPQQAVRRSHARGRR